MCVLLCASVCVLVHFESSMYRIAWFQNQSLLKWKHYWVWDHPGIIFLCENFILYMNACMFVYVELKNYPMGLSCKRVFGCHCVWVLQYPPILLFMGGSEKWSRLGRKMGQWWHSLLFTPSGYGPLYITSIHHKVALQSHTLPIAFISRCLLYMC